MTGLKAERSSEGSGSQSCLEISPRMIQLKTISHVWLYLPSHNTCTLAAQSLNLDRSQTPYAIFNNKKVHIALYKPELTD